MEAAVLRYRVMAYVTGVVLVVLCFVGIPLQVAGHPAVANDVGVVHGILYIIYLVFAWLLARRLRLAVKPTGDHAAGRDRPDHDVHRRAVGHPPVHQARAGRPRPGPPLR